MHAKEGAMPPKNKIEIAALIAGVCGVLFMLPPVVHALEYSVAAGNGEITVYDSSDLSVLFRNSEAHRGRVNDVAFYVDPDDNNIQWIVSGGTDGDLKLWSIPAPGP